MIKRFAEAIPKGMERVVESAELTDSGKSRALQ